MTKKTMKRALLSSVIAMFLCIAMLIGTTFAWFTDSATSGVNKIQAGNLDVELKHSRDGNTWTPVTATDDLFGDVTLWEPGATSVVYLELSNKGTLDLKYRFSMSISSETPGTNVNDVEFKLSDYLQFSFIEGDTVYTSREEARAAAGTGTTLSAQNSAGRAYDVVGTMAARDVRYMALVVFMPENVGNDANYKTGTTAPTIEMGINVVATQLASESDSFDNQYDGGANVDNDYMNSASAVVTAPAAGETLNIVLNNNAPASQENSTALTMTSVPATLAEKEVEFISTAMNDEAAQANFSVATDNSIEVAALKLEMKVDGTTTSNLGGTATITTYIQPGLTGVKVTYVADNGDKEEIAPQNVEYDPATGKLSFKTTHFSDYVVTATALTENVEGVYEIYSANDLFTFAKMVNVKGNTFSGKTVKLMADIDLKDKVWTPVGQTGGYSAKTYFQGTFDGNNKTISNLNIPASTWEAGSDGKENFATGFFGFIDEAGKTINDVTFDKATVEGHHWVGVAAGYMTGTVSGVKVTNSTVTSTYKTSEADGDKAGGVVGYLNSGSVTGCTVTASTITAVRDCGSVVGYSTANGTVTGNTAENCTVYYSTDDDAQIGGEIAGKRASGVSGNAVTNVAVIKMLTTQEKLDAEIAASDNVNIVLAAGNFVLKNEAAKNKTVTIKGTKDTVVTVVGDTGNQENYQNGATLAFEGVTIKGQTAGNFGGIAHVAVTTFVDCKFEGKLTLYGNATFINCEFNNDSDYAIWTWGARNANFVGCTFNSGGKAILLYGGSGSTDVPTTNLTVTNCVFNDNDTLATEKAAIEIGNDYNATYTLTVNNTTVNGFAVNPNGISTGSTIWANKNSMNQEHLNVVIDGVDVY